MIISAEEERHQFMMSVCSHSESHIFHTVDRRDLFDDVLLLFSSEQILMSYPMRISFKGELAIDSGGVFREMISAFWEVAYKKCCDGDSLLVPVVHPALDCSIFSKLGSILSHGYLQCGFLPLRIAFPTLAIMLLGTHIQIPKWLLLSTFIDSLNSHEQDLLKAGLKVKEKAFSQDLQAKLVAIVSRFGGRDIPTPLNLKELVVQIAKYQFQTKPAPAIMSVHTGIPGFEHSFWESRTLGDIHSIYTSLVATVEKVLGVIQEPDFMNACEERIFTYLTQFVGNMKPHELSAFLRFVSGSSVCLGKRIAITFNSSDGLARRPVAHTCDCVLELPITYHSYLEFTEEFQAILTDPVNPWLLNAI